MKINVLLSPAEFAPTQKADLSGTTCVVFDVLRATSSMLTALNNGAEAIIPVCEIAEALEVHARKPGVLLAGERNGLRITAEQTGSVDFDFGNSPRDFMPGKVAGKTIAWTTTNGTRALRACAHAEMVLIGVLVNLSTVARIIKQLRPPRLLIVCSGTFEDVAYEDTFAAGALVEALSSVWTPETLSDTAHIARATYLAAGGQPAAIEQAATNARKLLSLPALRDDVPLCLAMDTVALNASLIEGAVRPMPGFGALLA